MEVLEKRATRGEIILKALIGALTGYIIAIILASIILNPSEVLRSVLWVYTNTTPITTAILFSIPIAASALGLTLAYRAKFITIGAEGQVILGSAVTLWFIAYSGINLQLPFSILLAIILASILGALYSLIVALLRIYAGANEILSSLMLNFIAMYTVNYLIATSWRIGPFTITKSIPEEYRLSVSFIIATLIVLTLLTWFILARTRFGLSIEVYGRAPRAAETYGYSPKTIIIGVSIISGLMAGLGGALAMLSFQHHLTPMSSPPGYGYMGVLVAWLSANNPIIAMVASIFFSTIVVLGRTLQAIEVPLSYVLAIQSMIVLSTLVAVATAKYTIRFRWFKW